MTINQVIAQPQLSARPAFSVSKHTDAGRSGKNNEDWHDDFIAYVEEAGIPLLVQMIVVADGIGGNVAGERASRLACDTIKAVMTSGEDVVLAIPARMDKAIHVANTAIYTEANQDTTLKGMGTTIVMAALVQRATLADLFVAHAGDSRAYLIRSGHAHLLTRDHTWAQEAVEAGYLKPEQAAKHPNRSVIKRYLGILEQVEVDHGVIAPGTVGAPPVMGPLAFLPGDALLLCTDGLTDVVNDIQIQTTVTQQTPDKAVRKLIDLANEAGGPDNITVLLVQWPPADGHRGRSHLLMAAATVLLLALLVGGGFFLRTQFGGMKGFPGTATQVNGPLATALITVTPTPSTTAIGSNGVVAVAVGTAPTATPTASATATPSPTPVTPTTTLLPTATPTFTPTHTLTPTQTPTPAPVTETPTIVPTATTTAQPANAPLASEAASYQIVAPFAGIDVNGTREIAWQGAPLALGTDEKIDVVWWLKGKVSKETAKSFVDVNTITGNSLKVDLDRLGLQAGESYEYAIVLVAVHPQWHVLKLVSAIDSFRYQPAQNKSNDTCTGPTCR